MLKPVVRWMGLVAVVTLMWAATPARAQDSTQNSDTGKELGLYLWLAGIDGSMGFGRVNDVPVNMTVSDIAKYLDFTMAGYFEYRQPKWIAGTDIFWVKLGHTRRGHIDGSNVDVDMNFNQYIGSLGGAYRVKPDFDVWLTGRVYTLKTSQTFQGSDLSSRSHTWADIYIGARYHYNFGERWIAIARADIGTGGSDFAWFGNAVVGYRFNDTFTLGASYRVLSLDRETGSGQDFFKYDITEDGLGIVANFSLK
ncbi:MAG TPA: hypothetical protein VJS69_07670 [Candidatus Krumholzibacteria bacterium]|nr:hypothetical protein [Candidatus Krumholzibacteria bacterium]